MVSPLILPQSYFSDLALKTGTMLQSDIDKLDPTKQYKILRFSYLEDDIFNEVRKRTYYIARMKTAGEQKNHLLDLIAMTGDEKDMFEPYYRQTTLELLEQLNPFTRNINPAYLDRLPCNYPEIKLSEFLQMTAGVTYLINGAKGNRFYDCIKSTNTIQYQADLIIAEGVIVQQSLETRFTNPLITLREITAEENTSWEALLATEQLSEFFGVPDNTPQVEYAVENKDIIYTPDKLVIFVENYDWMNLNSIPTTDTMMFECITLGIMFNWFLIALPEEAKNYIAMYQQKLLQVSAALNSSNGWKRKYTYP